MADSLAVHLASALAVKGDRVSIQRPLCIKLFFARVGGADLRDRGTGKILVLIPALKGVASAGYIICCRQGCSCAVGVFGHILAVGNGAVIKVKRDRVGICPLCRQSGNVCRNAVAGGVKVAVTVLPLRTISNLWRSQTVGRGSGKGRAVLDNDLNIIGAAAQLAAVQIKRDGFQSVRAQCVSVQDFKDGAETDVHGPVRSSIVVIPVAGRVVPTFRASRRVAAT